MPNLFDSFVALLESGKEGMHYEKWFSDLLLFYLPWTSFSLTGLGRLWQGDYENGNQNLRELSVGVWNDIHIPAFIDCSSHVSYLDHIISLLFLSIFCNDKVPILILPLSLYHKY